ncbi:dihydroorotase [Gluconacetobacter azotocaptans]|nr:dihydroorotase [Gluconacetobacter azotocaptans]GBQ29674.1 dihydroorotase [Gluconacetobacter azotocaptans DSM 13594]
MDHYDLILRNGVVIADGRCRADVGCIGGKIAAIGDLRTASGAQVIDCTNLTVLPGLIDPHVHLRDPGDPRVETFLGGTRGAVLGGITTLFDMPNTAEPVTSRDRLERKIELMSGQIWCDVGLYLAATKTNSVELGTLEQQENVCAIKVFLGSAKGELLVDDDASVETIMRDGARRICFHSEDETRLQERKKLFLAGGPHRLHADWHDVECAFLGTRRLAALARRTGRPIHILHVSTAEELSYLQDFRDLVTTELLVNHLTHFGPDIYDTHGGFAVMNPPIRDRRHYDAAWAAVRDGMVDCIGSDHAPHSREAKERPWPETAAGLTGVQTLVPVMLNHVSEGRLSLERMVQLMAEGPARVYGLANKGRIAIGYDADFTVVDPDRRRTIEQDWIASPCGWTPFDGYECTGWPAMTVIRGQIVMREDEVLGSPSGRPAGFSTAGLS